MRIIKAIFLGLMLILQQHCGQQEEFERINASFMFINNASVFVEISGSCGFEEGIDESLRGNVINIAPGDSILVMQKDRVYTVPPSPSIDNIDHFPGSCFAVYGDSIKCEFGAFTGIRNLDNYEKVEEVTKNNFQFVYRFTDNTMSDARDCE